MPKDIQKQKTNSRDLAGNLAKESRVVDLLYKRKPKAGDYWSNSPIISTTPQPALLATCQESRYEALRSYKNLLYCLPRQYVYFNPSIDTLFWTPGCVAPTILQGRESSIWESMSHERSKIERLVLPCSAILGCGHMVQFDRGRFGWDEFFSGDWSIVMSNTLVTFSLLWIFKFFAGLKELKVEWYTKYWRLSKDGKQVENEPDYLHGGYALRKQNFVEMEERALEFAADMSRYYKNQHPEWNPPKIYFQKM